jgi:hypothetical protein
MNGISALLSGHDAARRKPLSIQKNQNLPSKHTSGVDNGGR